MLQLGAIFWDQITNFGSLKNLRLDAVSLARRNPVPLPRPEILSVHYEQRRITPNFSTTWLVRFDVWKFMGKSGSAKTELIFSLCRESHVFQCPRVAMQFHDLVWYWTIVEQKPIRTFCSLKLGGIDFLVLLIAIAFALGPMQNTMALNHDQDIFVPISVLCQ